MKSVPFQFSLLLFLLSGMASLSAAIKLPAIFTNNMVLQQQTQAAIWGKARPGKTVSLTTSWNQTTYTTQAQNDGSWKILVKTPVASLTPYTISISDGQPLLLENVLIGDVWICSGQSNMEMQVMGFFRVQNAEQEVANSHYPNIRLLQVAKKTSNYPLDDVQLENKGWTPCSPTSIPPFSAVAYFFGRKLYQELNIPIGLINTSWGGTFAEAWTSAESVATMPDLRPAIHEVLNLTDEQQEELFAGKMEKWQQKVQTEDVGFDQGRAQWAATNLDDSRWNTMTLPGFWDEKALPRFDGIVWFRKTLTLPETWIGQPLTLSLGSVDDQDITYCNGVQIGTSENSLIQRNYPIPASLVKDRNVVLTVRVLDTGGAGGLNSEPERLYLSNGQGEKIDLSGEWSYQCSADLTQIPAAPRHAINNPNRTSVLYNGMIHPLTSFAIRGAIWYQGEENVNRAWQYREIFPNMIQDWRTQWKSNFPFYFVQLANFNAPVEQPEGSKWAELREAQTMALKLSNTGMAVTTDIGEAFNIHPGNKQEVGRRLALAALAKTYGQSMEYSVPMYQSLQILGNQIRITFSHAESGLKTKDGQEVKGFSIAGLDHKFHWADAKIEGNTIVVSCPEVSYPIAIRYAWADNPDGNLYNGADLPASAFRTDDWPGITYRKID